MKDIFKASVNSCENRLNTYKDKKDKLEKMFIESRIQVKLLMSK